MVEMSHSLRADIPDTGETRINLPGGGRIEPVTASARSRLGQRITAALQDETHSWTALNGGRRLADNQRRNLAGMGGRFLETTNAWDPAEQSVAQHTHDAAEPACTWTASTGRRQHPQRPRTPPHAAPRLRRLGPRPRAGAPAGSTSTASTPKSRRDAPRPRPAERFFLNRIRAAETRRSTRTCGSSRRPEPHGARRRPDRDRRGRRPLRDALAMVATEVTGGHQMPLGIWERPRMPTPTTNTPARGRRPPSTRRCAPGRVAGLHRPAMDRRARHDWQAATAPTGSSAGTRPAPARMRGRAHLHRRAGRRRHQQPRRPRARTPHRQRQEMVAPTSVTPTATPCTSSAKTAATVPARWTPPRRRARLGGTGDAIAAAPAPAPAPAPSRRCDQAR